MAERFVPCPDCVRGTQKTDCQICFGSGREICPRCHGDRVTWHDGCTRSETCHVCHGHGDLHCTACSGVGNLQGTCPTCLGVGQIEEATVHDLLKQRQEVARKAEEERLARQKKAEEERLAQQKRQEEAARKAEADRLAREQEALRAQAEYERRWKAEEPVRLALAAKVQREQAAKGMWRKAGFGCLGIWLCLQVITLVAPLFLGQLLHPVRPRPASSAVASADSVAQSFSERELTETDLSGKSKWELTVMRNEPYARHGFKFGQSKASVPLYTHFSQFPWYHPDSRSVDAVYERLTPTERHNAQLILNYQKANGLR